ARGIDVDDITHVINYQLPDEIETYTHRSGRTGRAGKTGVSMVIVSKSEARKIKQIEKIIQKSFERKEIPSGMEICEVQLFHLANSIKETKINPEIGPYLPNITEVLEEFSKEELIKKVFSVEFTRFYNYYKKSKDLNVSGGDMSEAKTADSLRYFINLGTRDDFNWQSLKDFLRDLLQLGQDDVFHVDVHDSFSFFNTDAKHSDLVTGVFDDFTLDGRKISVEISKEGRTKGGGKSGGRGKGKGGFKKRSRDFGGDKPSFKGKSRRRTDRPDKKGTGGRRRRNG
nr:ATP-dependent RNA helicase [Flavobacteriaceae bacterium]